MKVLIISRNAWDDTNAIGNTISNFFEGIEGLEFANIYFRSSKPNNTLCHRYYHATEKDVLINWFSPEKIGEQFVMDTGNYQNIQTAEESKERHLVQLIQKYHLNLAYKLSDYIWYSQKWINGKIKSFVESFSPDIIFTFVKSAPQYYLTIRFIREKYNIPLMSWIADDEYTGYKEKKAQREIDNLQYILRESSVVRGCSQEICDYYNAVFGCKATPLYKGCDFSAPVKSSTNQCVKMVYAGNLLYGRLDILKQISETLESLAKEGKKTSLEIYSNTLISAQDKLFFAEKTCTQYMGRRDYEIIKQELTSADVVLHVESFEPDQLLKTKYSFSTKIIDALQSGSVMLAIGPEEQASMRYIRGIPGACAICDPLKIREELITFLEDAPAFRERAQKIREFARQKHDAITNAEELHRTMIEIVEGAV